MDRVLLDQNIIPERFNPIGSSGLGIICFPGFMEYLRVDFESRLIDDRFTLQAMGSGPLMGTPMPVSLVHKPEK